MGFFLDPGSENSRTSEVDTSIELGVPQSRPSKKKGTKRLPKKKT